MRLPSEEKVNEQNLGNTPLATTCMGAQDFRGLIAQANVMMWLHPSRLSGCDYRQKLLQILAACSSQLLGVWLFLLCPKPHFNKFRQAQGFENGGSSFSGSPQSLIPTPGRAGRRPKGRSQLPAKGPQRERKVVERKFKNQTKLRE